MLKVLHILCLIHIIIWSADCTLHYAVYEGDGIGVHDAEGEENVPALFAAKATYEQKINETGWAFLEIHTSELERDDKQTYAAGFIEGFLTHELIWMHYQNVLVGFCDGREDVCGLIKEYLSKNVNYMRDMITRNKENSYWYQAYLYELQVLGLIDGYNNATKDTGRQLTAENLFWLNMLGDFEDLMDALKPQSANREHMLFGTSRCSGLVKILPDKSELFTAQATWNSYESMLRIQKKYVLPLRISPSSKERIPGSAMSMSSYPGVLQSSDDFYVISSGLVAAETTAGNSNTSLFKNVKPVGQVLEFVRTMLANRLARNGHQWVSIFRKHNSGTYNNQWYIVDYNRFHPSRNGHEGVLKKGLLWIIEQLPGYTDAADMTDTLIKQTYWPSYNVFYFPRMFNLSGGAEAAKNYGEIVTYEGAPRAKIFQREHSKIRNIDDVYRVMRYNDFKNDPLSICDKCEPKQNAWFAIASRCDLNPKSGKYPFETLGHRDHGATDAKITSYKLHKKQQFLAVSGPTYDVSKGIEPFSWSTSDFNSTHLGHPDKWMFAPAVHEWKWG